MPPAFIAPKKWFPQWGGGTALFFVYTHFSQDVATALLVPLLPLIRADFGLNYLQSGLALSAYNITSGLSQFLGGGLGGRVKLKLVLSVGLGGVGIGTFLTGLAPSYYSLLALLVATGIFSGGYHPSSNSMLSTYFEAGRRGKVVGFHMMGGTLALVVAPVFGGLIADSLNWHYSFVLLSLPAIAGSLMVSVVLGRIARPRAANGAAPPVRPAAMSAERPSHGWSAFREAWRPVGAVITLTLLSQVAAQAAVAFVPVYFVDKHKVAAVYAAMLLAVLRIGGIPGGIFGGWLTDRLGARRAVVTALAATGPVLFLITVLPSNWIILVGLAAFGAILIIRQAAVQTYLMDNTPPQLTSLVFGLYFGLSHEGSSVVQPVVGYLMDLFGIENVFTGLALASIAFSALAVVFIGRKGGTRRHGAAPPRTS